MQTNERLEGHVFLFGRQVKTLLGQKRRKWNKTIIEEERKEELKEKDKDISLIFGLESL